MKKEETPILEPIHSFSSCLDQARNILFPNIFLKKKEEISGLEENFHLVFKTPLNMSEGERRTSLEVESK
jgi:hypothetical protein